MSAAHRKDRLETLLNLAQTYRGWNRRQLASALGRDTTKLVPESGLPKLDLLMDLARVLDWSVADVAHHVWCGNGDKAGPDNTTRSYEALQEESRQAHRAGQFAEAASLAKQAIRVAAAGQERAVAFNRLAMAYDGLGRYTKSLEALQLGLREPGLTANTLVMLQVNLANAYYALWHLTESTAMAQNLVLRYEAAPPEDRLNRVVQAFAHYVRGHSYRRQLAGRCESRDSNARLAQRDLEQSERLYRALAEEFDDQSYGGIADTCAGGLLEVAVALGRTPALDALRRIEARLDEVVDPRSVKAGDALESLGWWCIFGCNIALRYVEDMRHQQQYMALFTNKADEIAEVLDNWAIRERVFSMDFARRQRFAELAGIEPDWMIDKDDVRLLAGTMGRFPEFQDIGWRILETARLAADN